jgi:hypothetical protein
VTKVEELSLDLGDWLEEDGWLARRYDELMCLGWSMPTADEQPPPERWPQETLDSMGFGVGA